MMEHMPEDAGIRGVEWSVIHFGDQDGLFTR